jgi:hypothetical protein
LISGNLSAPEKDGGQSCKPPDLFFRQRWQLYRSKAVAYVRYGKRCAKVKASGPRSINTDAGNSSSRSGPMALQTQLHFRRLYYRDTRTVTRRLGVSFFHD